MRTTRSTEAGMNLVEMAATSVLVAVALGVAISVGQRFGIGWSIVAAPAAFYVAWFLAILVVSAIGLLVRLPARSTGRHSDTYK